MDYIIATGRSVDDLQEVVMEYITEGYRPIGGPFVSQNDRGTPSQFGQAMLKE